MIKNIALLLIISGSMTYTMQQPSHIGKHRQNMPILPPYPPHNNNIHIGLIHNNNLHIGKNNIDIGRALPPAQSFPDITTNKGRLIDVCVRLTLTAAILAGYFMFGQTSGPSLPQSPL